MKTKYILLYTLSFTLIAKCVYPQTANNDSISKRHNEMMAIIMTQPKVPIKTIGILVYDGYNTLDAMGPYHTLSEIMGSKAFFIAKQKGMVKNQRGLLIQVDTSFSEVKSLDILVIPGGAVETFMQTQDTTTLNWIKRIDKTTKYTTSVCTGSWILGATGLLKGKNATSNWYRAEEMMTIYGANFKKERWVTDGKYWTSAGVTAGMDMSLAIIDDLFGRKYTEGVMLNLEYDPKPPYNAGSPEKTEPIVADMMKKMYDMILLPLIDAEKKKVSPKNPTIFSKWPALGEYHKIMSATFHPAEVGNLEPLKDRAIELKTRAKYISQSAIPEDFQKPGIQELISKLEKESASLAELVIAKKADDTLKKAIYSLHDRFHEIMGKCRE
ncbi:MAG: DJ-1/PfpI family protein [Bacteroidetes bacterium]|nr:DJ-1/PfpI family protein [Bacteroidota bacterium]